MWSEEEFKRMATEDGRDSMHYGYEASENSTCEERYYERIAHWLTLAGTRRRKNETKETLRALHDRWWILHNTVAHPALGIWPCDVTFWLHRVTSDALNDENIHTDLPQTQPEIKDRWSWFVHNTVAHLAIGLFPGKAAFEFHDKTAKEMGVPGWV